MILAKVNAETIAQVRPPSVAEAIHEWIEDQLEESPVIEGEGVCNFTGSTWTIEDTDRKRERLRRISDAELLSVMESAHRMCSPGSYWGKGPRLAYVIQRELVRLEICKRGASYTESSRLLGE